ncbi:MAG: GNAT family N-acetyltransferase [Phycisphaerales bacterium]|nr:MAG: GNAT family N-acetyltransferase [Phycisphaerales bacterium]
MIAETRNRDLLERLLRNDEVWGGYALGDLQEPHFSRTKWHLCELVDSWALVMSYAFGESLTLMTFGEGQLLAEILRDLNLSGRCDLHVHRDHLDFVRPLFDGDWKAFLRLGLDRADFRPAEGPFDLEVRTLRNDDAPAALELYRHYPQNFFAPERIEEGQYVGGWRAERMVAVAGTHVVSPSFRVAAVGDIVVDPSCRGEGIGAALTSLLCRRLFETVDLIVLNVAEDNTAARRCYEKLRFARAVAHFEGFSMRRAGVT